MALDHCRDSLLSRRKQGNVTRKLEGGLLGLGHVRKGTEEMGDPIFEYEYADAVLNNNSFKLLLLDLWIMYRGFLLIVKGGVINEFKAGQRKIESN